MTKLRSSSNASLFVPKMVIQKLASMTEAIILLQLKKIFRCKLIFLSASLISTQFLSAYLPGNKFCIFGRFFDIFSFS